MTEPSKTMTLDEALLIVEADIDRYGDHLRDREEPLRAERLAAAWAAMKSRLAEAQQLQQENERLREAICRMQEAESV